MKSVLVGAVESTRVLMEGLLRHGMPPEALLTVPSDRADRYSTFVDVGQLAEREGVPVHRVHNINDPETVSVVRAAAPDYLFVVGWSQICRREIMGCARIGNIGFHPALLPENRGRGVIPWTIIQGARRTGTTLFWMGEGMDDGDVMGQESFAVAGDETAKSLLAKHLEALSRILDECLPLLKEGKAPRVPQDHSKATFCAQRKPEDGWIDWSRSAHEVWTLIRAVGDPYPGAFTISRERKLTILEADHVVNDRYWGVPGQVQEIDEQGVLVLCGDNHLLRIRTVREESAESVVAAATILKRHERLGLPPRWLEVTS